MSYFHLWHWKQDFECKSLSVWLLDTSRMTEGWPYIRAADKSPSRYTVAVSVSLSLFLVPLAFSMIVSGNCVMNEYVWESMPQLCEHTHARARRTQQIERKRNRPKIEFVFVIICWYELFFDMKTRTNKGWRKENEKENKPARVDWHQTGTLAWFYRWSYLTGVPRQAHRGAGPATYTSSIIRNTVFNSIFSFSRFLCACSLVCVCVCMCVCARARRACGVRACVRERARARARARERERERVKERERHTQAERQRNRETRSPEDREKREI